jgi:hypothetical protein
VTEREALVQLGLPEPEPFRQVRMKPADYERWDEWNARRIEALAIARSLAPAVDEGA